MVCFHGAYWIQERTVSSSEPDMKSFRELRKLWSVLSGSCDTVPGLYWLSLFQLVQWSRISSEYGFAHLSAGDLLHEEVKVIWSRLKWRDSGIFFVEISLMFFRNEFHSLCNTTMRKVGKCWPSAKCAGSPRGLTPKTEERSRELLSHTRRLQGAPLPCIEERSTELRSHIRQTKVQRLNIILSQLLDYLQSYYLRLTTRSAAVYIVLT